MDAFHEAAKRTTRQIGGIPEKIFARAPFKTQAFGLRNGAHKTRKDPTFTDLPKNDLRTPKPENFSGTGAPRFDTEKREILKLARIPPRGVPSREAR